MARTIKTLSPVSEGSQCSVELDGKIYKRIVRFRRDVGLYIVINNREYYEYEFNYDDFYKRKEGD